MSRTQCPMRTLEAALSLGRQQLSEGQASGRSFRSAGAGHGGEVAGILRRADAWRCEADGPGWACVEHVLEEICIRLMEPELGFNKGRRSW